MKVAHLIMAYKNPDQIGRMIRAMNHPNFYFFIHLDLKIDFTPFQNLASNDRVYFINNRVLCNWGGFSFVQAIISSLSEVLSHQEDFSLINLLSGQDYPIKSSEYIYEFYRQNSEQCFISYDDDPERRWWAHAIKRAEHYHLTDFNFRGKYFVQRFLNRILPKRKFPADMGLYGSSNSSWWTITADCAKYILDYMNRNPKLESFMKYTWGGDEFLIATIVMNSNFKYKTINNNYRFIKWAGGLANPMVLKSMDFDSIKSSSHLFARKFDITVDSEILNKIDTIIKIKHTDFKTE